jgi:UPF0042 nucleotide-binding protein
MSDQFLLITGLSGAGRSSAADVLEDIGWLVIDNLPPPLIPRVADIAQGGPEDRKIALVIGGAGKDSIREVIPAIRELKSKVDSVRVLFLDANEEALVRRFEETRRKHPFKSNRIQDAILLERKELAELRSGADIVIDSSDLNIHQLRERLVSIFADSESQSPLASVISFGFAYGIPLDVDMVLDVRFLPNPHWIPELRHFTGLDQPVKQYVLDQPSTKQYLKVIKELLEVTIPGFIKEGKSYISIGIGCTGGKHRSVVIAEEVSKMMYERSVTPKVQHRDINRS